MMYRRGRKTKQFQPAKPFTGMLNQLRKETVVLIALDKFEGFKKAMEDAHVDYDLGDFYSDGIIVMKK